jgi:hypothetical protein
VTGARWQPPPAPGGLLGCHHYEPGSFDESARRVDHRELAAARALVDEGHHVRSQRERPGLERTADFEVCGRQLEVKSFDALEERGRPANRRSVHNRLVSAHGQADAVMINAGGSGLSAAEARAGMGLYARSHPDSPLGAVRIMGDGFDLAWSRECVAERSVTLNVTSSGRRRSLQLGI